jgi:hypothetical protein
MRIGLTGKNLRAIALTGKANFYLEVVDYHRLWRDMMQGAHREGWTRVRADMCYDDGSLLSQHGLQLGQALCSELIQAKTHNRAPVCASCALELYSCRANRYTHRCR